MKSKILLVSLIFISFLSVSTLQASFTKEEQETLREVNHSNIKAILEKYTQENADILNSSKGKDVVAFIGKTGSGKSTLINYLNDKQLRVSDTGAIVLSDPSDPAAMKIGIGFESETFLPKFINYQNLLFYDLPGIGDTRGTAISLVNACFIKSIIENAKTVRLIFVIGLDQLTAERGRSFKELSDITKNLIPNEIVENFSCLVITKTIPGRNNQQLINRLVEMTEPGVLTPWIQAGKLTHMSAPFGDEINQNDKAQIIHTIQNTPFKKLNNVNIGVIYNDREQNKIRDIYAAEIENIFNTLLNNNINMSLISSLDISALDNKKHYFQNSFLNDLVASLNKSALISLLRPFSEDIYTSCWNDVRGNKQIEIQNILERIGKSKAEAIAKKAEEDRKEEEKQRIQAENALKAADQARIAEQQRRIVAEQAQQTAENARRVEEQKRIALQNEIRATEQRRIQADNARKAEEQRRIQAENTIKSVQAEQQKAEQLNNPKFLYDLGNEYYHKGNKKEGFKYYLQSADKGYLAAQHTVAYCYHEGYGTNKDLYKSFSYFKEAAEKGYRDSQYCLAAFYRYGRIVPQNYSRTMYWYQKAADQGCQLSKDALIWIPQHGL